MKFFFFFSSRRRHTRLQGDWSSDVCSSDLDVRLVALAVAGQVHEDEPRVPGQLLDLLAPETGVASPAVDKHDRVTAFAFDQVVDLVRAEGGEVGIAGDGRILRARPAGEQQKRAAEGGKA